LIGAHILWHLSLSTFLLCYVLTFVLTTLVLLFDLWRADELKLGLGRMRVPKRMARSMIRYSAFTFGSGLASIAVGNIDQVMVGAMLSHGLDYVAYYAVAMFLASLIMVPTRALVLPMLPILANAWRKRDHDHIEMIYHRTASIQLVSSGFLFLCLLICIDPLFSFLKPEYGIIGKPVLIVLGITNVLNLSTGLSGGIVSTSRSFWFDAVSGAMLLALNVLFDYLFILWWGVVGAAWSSLASVIIVVGWRLVFLRRRFDLWPYDGKSAIAFVLIAAFAIGAWSLPHAGPPIIDMIWRCALLSVLYWPLVHVLRIAPELGEQMNKVFRRATTSPSRS
jgi:O-antigen/teichoic acid export membrane protein